MALELEDAYHIPWLIYISIIIDIDHQFIIEARASATGEERNGVDKEEQSAWYGDLKCEYKANNPKYHQLEEFVCSALT